MTSGTFILAMILLPIFVLACLGMIFASWLFTREEPGLGWTGVVFFVLCLAGTLAGFGYGLYPYDMAYHSYRPITGVATENVESRFIGGDGGPTQNYLVSLPSGQYRCDDTRCARIKKGDHVKLSCIKNWVYAGADGEVCKIVEVER